MKWILKAFIAVYLVTHTFDITMAIFEMGQNVVQQSAGIITGTTSLDFATVIGDILLHEHTDKLVAQDKGDNHPGYRNHHVITQIADHGENVRAVGGHGAGRAVRPSGGDNAAENHHAHSVLLRDDCAGGADDTSHFNVR